MQVTGWRMGQNSQGDQGTEEQDQRLGPYDDRLIPKGLAVVLFYVASFESVVPQSALASQGASD
jgi:hypothetical protein